MHALSRELYRRGAGDRPIHEQSKPTVLAAGRPGPGAWLAFAIATLLLCGYAVFAVRTLLNDPQQPYKILGSFYASGFALSHHLNPYGVYPTTWRFHPYGLSTVPVVDDINLSPPCMLPLFTLLLHHSLPSEVVVWTAVSTLFFVLSTAILLVASNGAMQKRQIVWCLLGAPALGTLTLAQDYAAMFLLLTLIWLLLIRGHLLLAAVLIGVMVAIKPPLGLWPLMLFASWRIRHAIVAALVAAALALYPVLLYGSSVYTEWIHAGETVPHWYVSADMSLAGTFTRLGARPFGIVLAVLTAAALLYFCYRVRPSQIDLAGIAICAAILCGPLGWFHYTIFAAPFFAARRPWGPMATIAAFLLAIPPLFESLVLGKGRILVLLVGLPHEIGLWMMLSVFLVAASGMKLTSRKAD
jgi:hypothetical protein